MVFVRNLFSNFYVAQNHFIRNRKKNVNRRLCGVHALNGSMIVEVGNKMLRVEINESLVKLRLEPFNKPLDKPHMKSHWWRYLQTSPYYAAYFLHFISNSFLDFNLILFRFGVKPKEIRSIELFNQIIHSLNVLEHCRFWSWQMLWQLIQRRYGSNGIYYWAIPSTTSR